MDNTEQHQCFSNNVGKRGRLSQHAAHPRTEQLSYSSAAQTSWEGPSMLSSIAAFLLPRFSLAALQQQQQQQQRWRQRAGLPPHRPTPDTRIPTLPGQHTHGTEGGSEGTAPSTHRYKVRIGLSGRPVLYHVWKKYWEIYKK